MARSFVRWEIRYWGGEEERKNIQGQEKKKEKNRKKRHLRKARSSCPPTLAGAFGTGDRLVSCRFRDNAFRLGV